MYGLRKTGKSMKAGMNRMVAVGQNHLIMATVINQGIGTIPLMVIPGNKDAGRKSEGIGDMVGKSMNMEDTVMKSTVGIKPKMWNISVTLQKRERYN
jgi:hypothetical protein